MNPEPINEVSHSTNQINQPLTVKKVNLRSLSVMFLILAGLFAVIGLWEMFVYDSDRDNSKIVGGDAYNYIIIAARGTGLICCGIVSALTSVIFSIWDLIDRQR